MLSNHDKGNSNDARKQEIKTATVNATCRDAVWSVEQVCQVIANGVNIEGEISPLIHVL